MFLLFLATRLTFEYTFPFGDFFLITMCAVLQVKLEYLMLATTFLLLSSRQVVLPSLSLSLIPADLVRTGMQRLRALRPQFRLTGLTLMPLLGKRREGGEGGAECFPLHSPPPLSSCIAPAAGHLHQPSLSSLPNLNADLGVIFEQKSTVKNLLSNQKTHKRQIS